MQYWIIEDKTFYAINIAANMVISSRKFFKADRYRYVVPIFLDTSYKLLVTGDGTIVLLLLQESLKVEMGLTEARLENSKRKLESDLRSELERQVIEIFNYFKL